MYAQKEEGIRGVTVTKQETAAQEIMSYVINVANRAEDVSSKVNHTLNPIMFGECAEDADKAKHPARHKESTHHFSMT